MATSSPNAASAWLQAQRRIAPLTAALARSGSILKGKAAAVVKVLQHAQMMSALVKLSDAQLAAIGIERSDIPSYAERLISADGEPAQKQP